MKTLNYAISSTRGMMNSSQLFIAANQFKGKSFSHTNHFMTIKRKQIDKKLPALSESESNAFFVGFLFIMFQ